MPRKHITVSGRVQGVGFRHHVRLLAEACRLTGFVCNLDSGEVSIEVQGYQEKLEQFLSRLGKGSMFIRIDRMDVMEQNEIHESGFEVRY